MQAILGQQIEIRSTESILEPQTQQLMRLAKKEGWMFPVIGQAPMLDQPLRLGDWLLVPAQEDTTPIPERTMQRIQAIFDAGIRPQGFVLVHEAPMLLKATTVPHRQHNFDLKKLRKIGGAAIGLGLMTGSLIAAVGIVLVGGLLILPAGLITALVLVDPILVVVMPDNTWVEIDRWDVH
jgi:hypothetical protein